MADGAITAMAQQMKPAEAFVKEETLEPPDIHADDDKEYLFEQQKVEESASAGPSATVTSNEEEEPPPKRARRTAAVKAAIAMDQESDDDDDSGEPMTKIEDESEDSEGEDHVPAFVDVPSTSADDQPGPSGVGKDGVEAPSMKQLKEDILRNPTQCRVVLTDLKTTAPNSKEETDKNHFEVTVILEESDESNDVISNFQNVEKQCEPPVEDATVVLDDSDDSNDANNCSANPVSKEPNSRRTYTFLDTLVSEIVAEERDPLDVSIILEDSNDKDFSDPRTTSGNDDAQDLENTGRLCEVCYDIFPDEKELETHMILHEQNQSGIISNPVASKSVCETTSTKVVPPSSTSPVIHSAFVVDDELYFVVQDQDDEHIPAPLDNDPYLLVQEPSKSPAVAQQPKFVSLANSKHGSNLGIQYPVVDQKITDVAASSTKRSSKKKKNPSDKTLPAPTQSSTISLSRLNQNIERMMQPLPHTVKPRSRQHEPAQQQQFPPLSDTNATFGTYTSSTLMELEAINQRIPLALNDHLITAQRMDPLQGNIGSSLGSSNSTSDFQQFVYTNANDYWNNTSTIHVDTELNMATTEGRHDYPPPPYQPPQVLPPQPRRQKRYRNTGSKVWGMPVITQVGSVRDSMIVSDSITVLSDDEGPQQTEEIKNPVVCYDGGRGKEILGLDALNTDPPDENDIENALPVSFIIK